MCDPGSGQPEFKHTPARVRPYRETWRGFYISRDGREPPAGLDLVWRKILRDDCFLHEFAGRGGDEERETLRRHLLKGAAGERLSLEDPGAGSVREAFVQGGRLDRALFATKTGRLPPRGWLAELFGQGVLSAEARASLLHGWAPGAVVDAGPQVCACLKVSASAISTAISGGAHTVDAVGEVTRAGTNCGSCRPEIARMIRAAAPPTAVEKRHAA